MSAMKFKSDDILTGEQLTVLVATCCLLILIYILATLYRQRKLPNTNIINVENIHCQRLSKTASVYSFSVDAKRVYIFESVHGVIELKSFQKEIEKSEQQS